MAKKKYALGADGYYRTKVWDGTYNKDGTKHRQNLCSKKSSKDLENQVEAFKKQVEESLRKGQIATQASDMSVYEYAQQWKKTFKQTREANTQAMYENIIEKKIVALSGVKLSEVSRIHFQQLINSNADHPRTCQQIQVTFKQIIKSAIWDSRLPAEAYDRICSDISLPEYKAPKKRPLTALEKEAIQKADFTDRERCYVYLIYGLGLRREEALALCRTDINLQTRKVRVHTAVTFVSNDPIEKGPKSDNGYREIPMPDFLCQFLSVYLHAKNGYLIQKVRGGGKLTKSSFRRMWDSIRDKINIAAGGNSVVDMVPGLTSHVFRHNFCTELCYQVPKISIKKIAEIMGDTEKMVMDVYSHIQEDKEKTAEAVESAIGF